LEGGCGVKDMTDGYVTADGRQIGPVVMEMKNITLRFGGVEAIKDISFDIRQGEIICPRDHRPEWRGQIIHAERDQRVLCAAGRRGLVQGQPPSGDETL
jgi:hypothetical protein